MKRGQLSDMAVFVEVARCGGFRAAARHLGLGAGSVSQAVQRFEDRLGVRLLERTTRQVALTAPGESLYRRCLPAITDIEGAIEDMGGAEDEVAGILKLTAPESAGTLFLNNLISAYLAAYPGVRVDLSFEDGKVDLVSSGLDAAIRSSALLEQDTHAVPVGPELAMAVVASPAYLEKHGTPEKPSDLTDRAGICFKFARSEMLAPWSFDGVDGAYEVTPQPRAVVNDLEAILHLAEAGVGIAYVYAASAARQIEAGRLMTLLDGMPTPRPKYSINYVSKRHMPERIRAFIDMAKKAPARHQ